MVRETECTNSEYELKSDPKTVRHTSRNKPELTSLLNIPPPRNVPNPKDKHEGETFLLPPEGRSKELEENHW